ncbi:MAG: RHS repeat protein, partial [Butyrivibrio sp.]|nr:RHS repeat protein [Butyrivibrio sp.]
MGVNGSGDNIEWHQKKIREYFEECFNTVYNPFLEMSDSLLIPSLLDFINDETHTGPEAESAKAFLNDQQITIIAMITDCVQQLQSMMQKGGFAGLVPLLDDFLADLSEDESQDPVIKTQHLKKVIEDFADYNTIFNEVHPKVTEIRNKANSIVSGCDVISINELINPDSAASVRAFDDFTARDKVSGFVPEFNQKFLTFHEEHSNDIAGSTFKQLLDDIVRLLKSIIDGMNKGTFDITRYEETKGNIRWIDPKDVEGLEAYLRTYKLYLQGLVDRCQVYKYDPVNMSSGNYINDRTDLEVGTDTKITFRRFYNARSEFKGAMGRGWSCNSDVHLYKEDNGDIRAIYIDGREGIYRKPENSKAAQKENTPELTFDGEEGATNKSSSVSETYYEIHGEPGKLVEDNYGYKLIREDLSYEEYDKDGYLVAKGDNTGENTRYTLGVFTKNDDNGESIRYALPVKIETKEGSYISLSYNEDGILTRVSTSQGKNVTYGYEKREDEYFLTAATYPNGSTRRYTYNEEGLIHKVISPDGIIALTNEYDEQRRVIHQIFPDGGEMSYSYDDEKNITTATEQNGLKVEYLSDERGRHTGTRYIGLSDDYASQDVENGKNIIEEKYTYNERNQKTSVTDKNGHTVRFSYDNRGNLTKIVGPEGLSESYTYDAEGRLIAKKDSEGNSYRFIYDFDGNLYCVTDPLGNRTKYDYKDGRVVRIRDA